MKEALRTLIFPSNVFENFFKTKLGDRMIHLMKLLRLPNYLSNLLAYRANIVREGRYEYDQRKG
uniref:Uncharacterized protein n=1 Tax=Onchocerca volvulus TaxID=6282 RepID=A0A8R1TY01_ONCVO